MEPATLLMSGSLATAEPPVAGSREVRGGVANPVQQALPPAPLPLRMPPTLLADESAIFDPPIERERFAFTSGSTLAKAINGLPEAWPAGA